MGCLGKWNEAIPVAKNSTVPSFIQKKFQELDTTDKEQGGSRNKHQKKEMVELK